MADISLIYEGVDITDSVDIKECVFRDASGRECDCLDVKLDHAERWLRWGPKKNDTIQVKRGGYDTKALYLNTIALEDGAYRIYATSAKSQPLPRRWQTFEGKTLQTIMGLCAGELGMGARLFGVDGAVAYDYLLRRNLTAPAFLEWLAGMEGAALKTLDGALVAIGIEYAQGIGAMHTIELSTDQADSAYIDQRDKRWSSVEITTPFGSGQARSSDAQGMERVITDVCVDNDAQAYRWAKGLLLAHNRKCEILRLESEFNPGYTAMARIDVESESDAKGQWIIDSVEHDMVGNASRPVLYRCLNDIG